MTVARCFPSGLIAGRAQASHIGRDPRYLTDTRGAHKLIRRKSMVKKLLGIAVLGLAFAAPAFAEDTSKTEKKQETEMGKDTSKSTSESTTKKKDAKGDTEATKSTKSTEKSKKTDKDDKELK
jgi:hypothetical protein